MKRLSNEDMTPKHSTQRAVKRAFDIAVSAVLLSVFSPLLLLIAVLIRLKMGRPVLFRQERPGLHGQLFAACKFRTMTDARGPDGKLLPDAQRLGRFGVFLRRTSLDELPQLWNVLRGDMSLVGPRPLLTAYLSRYSPEQARRHEVPPGITGWAQIHGRNAISWEEKFSLDVWYVDHWSLLLDLRILLMTVASVLRRDGISAAGHCTMPEFHHSDSTGGQSA